MTGADGQTIDVMANLDRQRAERHRQRSESAPTGKAPGKPAGERKADGAAAETPATPKGRSDDAKRWATLNGFHDSVAEHLTPIEQSVWHYLFRWCRDGKAEASLRRMAERNGIDFKTATTALRWLIEVGLVWEIYKSKHKGTSSIYGVHPSPGTLAEACAAANAPRLVRRKGNRRPPVRRSSRPKKPR
jgi:hypothetical protein